MNHILEHAVMVVHGPEIFDTGEVRWLLSLVRPARTIVAGVMAQTAAEESGLPVECPGKPPSVVLAALEVPEFLANHGKTAESGKIFGGIVASRLGDRGLVHLECSNRILYVWNTEDSLLARALSHLTGFTVQHETSARCTELPVRQIRGCIPGEPVYLNGIIIGMATADTVVIRSSGNRIEPVSGLEPKPHGLEKILRSGPVELQYAWCKSGPIRAASPKSDGHGPVKGNVLVIDHCGHEIYSRLRSGCCGVLAIGDDTTAVCGHICAHRGIPVFGIVDGDRDTIVPTGFARGSVVVETTGERDDDMGAEVRRMVHGGTLVWDDWVETMLGYLQGRVKVIHDFRLM
jgi:hypothetical protein